MSFIFLIIPAFIAGLLMFLAPCTLPLAPAYLGFISGVSAKDLQDPSTANSAKRKVFMNGLFFVIGFTTVFVLFGVLVGLIGSVVTAFYRIWLTRISGLFIIIFGLSMVGLFKLPFFQTEKKIKIPASLKKGKAFTSSVLGAGFAFGWTPCIGPILGTILTLASTTGTILQGGILLFIFSMGLAIPFLLLALGIGAASKYINRLSKYLNFISVLGGVFLIVLGILLVTNNFSILIAYGYQLFSFFNYQGLLEYL